MRSSSLLAGFVLLVASTCQAALFSGPSGFSAAPFTQMGTVTNNLVLTDTATGFVVSGQVLVNVPAGAVAGILVSYTVDRPLDPTYGTSSMFTTTVLDGFSQPPAGSFGNSGGGIKPEFTNYPGVSSSPIPMTLTAGAAIWPNITVNSSTFSYTSGGVNFLRQRFDLYGDQTAGAGGTWTVDVPVTTFVTAVPEPSTIALGAAGFGVMLGCVQLRRRNALRQRRQSGLDRRDE